MPNSPKESKSSSGFTLIEVMVVLGMISFAAVYGAQMLVSLGRGVKGNQEAADFIQAQGTGYYALSANPHQFCVDAKIIGLQFPTLDEVGAYIQSQSDPTGAAAVPPDLLNSECVKYPFSVAGAQVTFVPKADRLLEALPKVSEGLKVEGFKAKDKDKAKAKDKEGRRELSSDKLSDQQGSQRVACQRTTPKPYTYHGPDYSGPVPKPPKIIPVPFSLGINRTTGGPIARELVVSLKVDQDGVIADCTPLGQAGGGGLGQSSMGWIPVTPAEQYDLGTWTQAGHGVWTWPIRKGVSDIYADTPNLTKRFMVLETSLDSACENAGYAGATAACRITNLQTFAGSKGFGTVLSNNTLWWKGPSMTSSVNVWAVACVFGLDSYDYPTEIQCYR